MKRIATAVLVLLVAVGAVFAYGGTTAHHNPLTMAEPVNEHFHGEVLERLDVDPYLYLRVADEQGQEHWVVTLQATASDSSHVTIQVYARAAEFTSRNANRTFAPLSFATVTTHHQETP